MGALLGARSTQVQDTEEQGQAASVALASAAGILRPLPVPPPPAQASFRRIQKEERCVRFGPCHRWPELGLLRNNTNPIGTRQAAKKFVLASVQCPQQQPGIRRGLGTARAAGQGHWRAGATVSPVSLWGTVSAWLRLGAAKGQQVALPPHKVSQQYRALFVQGCPPNTPVPRRKSLTPGLGQHPLWE